MGDTEILFTGVIVFGLMLVAVILTVMEFRDLDERPGKYVERKSEKIEGHD